MIRKIAIFALCAVMILTSAVLPTAFTVKAAELVTATSYDYSNPASDRNVTVTAVEFLENLGYSLSDAEAEYLNAYCDFKLNYDRVSQDKVEKRVTGAENEPKNVEIAAEIYTYTAKDGTTTVTWTPVKVDILSGDTVICSESTYTVEGEKRIFAFESFDLDLSYDYRVQYCISDGITVFADDVNLLLDYAYDEISASQSHLDFYSSNEAAVNAYYKYLRDKRIWDQNKAAFDAYPSLLAKYEEDLLKYKDYRDRILPEYLRQLEIYNSEINSYNQELALYNEYLAVVSTMQAQIDNMDTALTKKMTYLEREIYACFFASLVDEVVANKDKLIAAFGNNLATPIDNSKAATENIRKIFRPEGGTAYDQLTTLDEKYTFYINNYESLFANIYTLTESLYQIYTTTGMVQLMHMASSTLGREDYTERLVIFIVQLVGLCDVLSDKPLTYTDGQGNERTAAQMTFNYRTQAGVDVKNRTISQIFGGEEFVKDENNATPIKPPAKINEPTPPSVQAPAEPEAVIEPTKPVQPADPGTPPTVVNKPAGMPEGDFDWSKFVNDASYRSLLQTLYSEKLLGQLTDRSDVSDINYVPTYNVCKPFNDSSYVSISFYDANKQLIDRLEIKKGSNVDFRALGCPDPVKAEDVSATYTFTGWQTADGQPFDYSASRDLELYPVFTVNYKNDYEISGKTLVATVSGDLVRLPISKFADIVESEGLEAIKAMAKDVGIKINYESLLELTDAGVDYLTVSVDSSSVASPKCRVNAYTAEGEAVNVSSPITLYLAFADLNSDVTYTAADGNSAIAGTESIKLGDDTDGTNFIHFDTALNKTDVLSVKYDISSYASSVQAPPMAAPGSVVTLDIIPTDGIKSEAYYILNGQRYPISGNSFVMPEGSVKIVINNSYIWYTVTFISDGKEIKKDYYKYGEPLDEWPRNPTKANDGQYSYKFKGWTPVREDFVYEDLVYVAVFERTPLPKEKQQINWLRVIVVTAFIIAIVGFVSLVLLILDKCKVISMKRIFATIFRRKDKSAGVSDEGESTAEGENTDRDVDSCTESAEKDESTENSADQ